MTRSASLSNFCGDNHTVAEILRFFAFLVKCKNSLDDHAQYSTTSSKLQLVN